MLSLESLYYSRCSKSQTMLSRLAYLPGIPVLYVPVSSAEFEMPCMAVPTSHAPD